MRLPIPPHGHIGYANIQINIEKTKFIRYFFMNISDDAWVAYHSSPTAKVRIIFKVGKLYAHFNISLTFLYIG